MDTLSDIFKRSKVNVDALIKYGFIKENNDYIYEKNFLDDKFKAIITISSSGIVSGKVIDLDFMEEYTNIKTESTREFVSSVRESYKDILIDIKEHCFEDNYFIFPQTNRINDYIKEKYHNIQNSYGRSFLALVFIETNLIKSGMQL